MRPKQAFCLTAAITIVCAIASAQDPEEDARELFLSTRPAKTESVAASTPKANVKSSAGNPIGKKAGDKAKKPSAKASDNIGLGYTIYLRNAEGKQVRVDPSREFHSGDAVRVLLEPNIDGYLYIVYAENDENPVLLFPDHRLNNGNNAVRAHVPYEVPSSRHPEPKLRWFFISGPPAVERLYVIVTRKPLPDVPVGEELASYRKTNKAGWKPSDAICSDIKAKANEPAAVSKGRSYGEAQSDAEQEAIGRHMSLEADAPEPSIVGISKSQDIFVTVIDLIHK